MKQPETVRDWLLYTIAACIRTLLSLSIYVTTARLRTVAAGTSNSSVAHSSTTSNFSFFYVNRLCLCLHTWISDDRTNPGTASMDEKQSRGT